MQWQLPYDEKHIQSGPKKSINWDRSKKDLRKVKKSSVTGVFKLKEDDGKHNVRRGANRSRGQRCTIKAKEWVK